MATNLGQTSILARKAVKYGGIGLIFLMIGRVILTASIAYWRSLHPLPPPPPDVKFGKLPKLIFPQIDQPTLTYTLETRTGGLPAKMETQYKVFFMPILRPSLLAYDKAKAVANRLEFIQDPIKLSDTDYRWNSSEGVPSSLTMNIITGAFTLDRRWQDDPAYATPTVFYSDKQALDRTFNTLSRVDLLPEDVKLGEHTFQYFRIEGDKLVRADSASQAQFIRVNLYRADVDKTRVVNPREDRGLISTLIGLQQDEDKQFVSIEYNYFPIESETSAVYPLITPTEAWKRMQDKGGFVAAYKPGSTAVVVRDVTLAYYDSDIPQQYLQPVYLFEGDDGFVGMVPAVSDSWVE